MTTRSVTACDRTYNIAAWDNTEGRKVSFFADADYWNNLSRSSWRNIPWIVYNYLLRSSLLSFEEVPIRNYVQSTGFLIYKVQLSRSLAKEFSLLLCTTVSLVTSSSESKSCAASSQWCSLLVKFSDGASVVHTEGFWFWEIFLRTSKTHSTN